MGCLAALALLGCADHWGSPCGCRTQAAVRRASSVGPGAGKDGCALNFARSIVQSFRRIKISPESDNVDYVPNIIQCPNNEITYSQASPSMINCVCVRHRPTIALHPLARILLPAPRRVARARTLS